MAEEYSISAKITADSTGFEKGIKSAEKSLDGFSKEIKGVASALGSLFATAQIAKFAKQSVSLIQQQEKELKLLNTTLKTTGASAWTTSKQLVEMAQSFEKHSNYSQEEIMRMQTVLLGFKSVTGDVFESASQEIINMATVMGMDLVSAVQTVGKALDDPIKGLGSLSRQGFVFDETQKAMLADMVAVGDKAGAQKIILEELATTYGGAGEAGQDAFKKLDIAMGNMQKSIGSVLLPSVTNLAESVTELLDDFANLDKGTQTFIVTSTTMITTLPLVIKGVNGLKVALMSLQSSVPVLLAISGAVIGISAAVSKIQNARNAFGNLANEIEGIRESTGQYLDTYAGGNEEKKLDEETTRHLIELYPQLSGKIDAYTTSVADARQAVEALINAKLLESESTGIAAYLKRMNDVAELQAKANEAAKTGNRLDQQYAKERMAQADAQLKIAEQQREAINQRIEGLGKLLTFDGKIINIPVKVTPKVSGGDVGGAVESAVSGEQSIWSKVFGIDDSLFSTGEEAAELFINGLEQQLQTDQTIADALGEKFEIADTLKAQAGEIKKAIEGILEDSTVNIEDLNKEGSALNTLVLQYKALIVQIQKLEKVEGSATKTGLSFGEAWSAMLDDVKADAEDWTDVVGKIKDALGEVAGEAFEQLGAALVDGSIAWADMGAVAMKALAGVLEGIAAQLSAMAVASAVTHDYGDAIAAAAGAAAAMVAAGAMSALATQSKQVADNLTEGVETLEEFRKRIKGILDDTSSIPEAFKNLSKLKDELTSAKYDTMIAQLDMAISSMFGIGDKSYEEYQAIYEEALKKEQVALQAVNNVFTSYNQTLQSTINANKSAVESYRILYDEMGSNSLYKAILDNEALVSLSEDLASVYDSLTKAGYDIGDMLVENIVEGAEKADFLDGMRDYIKKSVVKLAVYTDAFQSRLADVGTRMSQAILNGWDLSGIKSELESLWNDAEAGAKRATEAIDGLFGQSSDEIESTLSELAQAMNTFADSINDLGGDIADNLISGLTDGLSQSDFLTTMYNYIRKLIVQTVVYTESMKAEIESIGKTISEGLSNGFSDTTLHEIRRDLSYIFYSANQQMSGIDELLSSVFSGYATGTDNATRGLHIVGEAGPELVSFRGGEKVFNADETRGILSGSSNNWNITFNNTSDTSAFEMMNQLRMYNREMALNAVI